MTGTSGRFDGTLASRRATLLAVAFVVSFCSFAYEFVYSELLTVIYGGTVTQYTITIGLYFFSLGVGSALSDDLGLDRARNFVRAELYLLVAAPLGFLFVVALNSVWVPKAVPPELLAVLARAPVLVVGFLSGFELPLLTSMVNDTASEDATGSLDGALRRIHEGLLALVAVPFAVSRSGGDRSGLSVTLAMDYLGGLVGAVVYARYLYPELGLVVTVFALAFLNGVAALAFLLRFGGWTALVGEDDATAANGSDAGDAVAYRGRTTAVLAVAVLLTGACGGVLVAGDAVDREVTSFYVEHQIESEYAKGAVDATVTDVWRTSYQRVVRYDRTWTGSGPNPHFANATERCLRLGNAVQLCDSWADSYHDGLVDVPLSTYENSTETDVLLVGGGDHVALDDLREHGVDVDRVDIDGEFMQAAKSGSFYTEKNDRAWRYAHLDHTTGDGFAYVAQTEETYDVVVLDVPGATDDDLLGLYSTEFYTAIRGSLEPDGVVATWAYSPYGHRGHYKAYMNTVRAAGFDSHLSYHAWEDIDRDGETERVERFYLLAPEDREPLRPSRGSGYVQQYADRYRNATWEPVPAFDGVEPNSVFHPNYDILIDYERYSMHTEINLSHLPTEPSLDSLDVKAQTTASVHGVPFALTVIGSSHYVGAPDAGFHELCSCEPIPASDATTVPLEAGVESTVPVEAAAFEGETVVRGEPLAAFPGPDDATISHRFGERAYTTITAFEDGFETYHTYPEFDVALYSATTLDPVDERGDRRRVRA